MKLSYVAEHQRKQELKNQPKPTTEEERAYWEKVAQDPKHYPDKFEILSLIWCKLNKRAKGGAFKPTISQRNLLNHLWGYFGGNGEFLDRSKGILLMGGFGVGKTEILKAFCTTHFKPFNPSTDPRPCQTISAIELVDYFNADQNFNKFFENNLYVDDFGTYTITLE